MIGRNVSVSAPIGGAMVPFQFFAVVDRCAGNRRGSLTANFLVLLQPFLALSTKRVEASN